MKAFAVDQDHNTLQDPRFRLCELEIPELGPRDVLVQLKAISVNPLDVKRRMLNLPQEQKIQTSVLGWDGCGVVQKVGTEVSLFKVGDEIQFFPISKKEFDDLNEYK